MREPSGVMVTLRSDPLGLNTAAPDVSTVVRINGAGKGRTASHTAADAMAAATNAMRVTAAMRRQRWPRGTNTAAAVPAEGMRLWALSSTNRTVETADTRRWRSLTRQ